MKIARYLLAALMTMVVAFFIVAFFLPPEAKVERQILIDAPVETVFDYVNSPRTFNEWSPWATQDPNIAFRYEGPESGEGAVMLWSSTDPTVGEGSYRIIKSEPHSRVDVRLSFGEGQQTQSYYQLLPEKGQTRFIWGFQADLGSNPLDRYKGLMLDAVVGKQYEIGLGNLRIRMREHLNKSE